VTLFGVGLATLGLAAAFCGVEHDRRVRAHD
jgi:hypothetical protein